MERKERAKASKQAKAQAGKGKRTSGRTTKRSRTISEPGSSGNIRDGT